MDPVRTLLFVPGHRDRMIEKAPDSGADGLLYDLEDSVPASERENGRRMLAAALATPRTLPRYIRVNGIADAGRDETAADLDAVVLADVERRIVEGEAHGERGWVLREYLKLAYQFLYEALIAWWEGKENEAAAYAYACDELCREIKAMHADFESHAELLSREHRVVHYGEESAWF